MAGAEPDTFEFPPGLVRLDRDEFPVDPGRVLATRLGGVVLPPAGAGRPNCLVYADLRRFVPATPNGRHAPAGALAAARLAAARLERVDAVFRPSPQGQPTGDQYALSLWRPVDLPDGARPLADCPHDRLPPLETFERFLSAACAVSADGVGCCPNSVWADPAGLYPLYWAAFRADDGAGPNPLPDLRRLAEAYLDGWVRRHGYDVPFRELAPAGWWDGLADPPAVAAAVANGRLRFDHRALGWRARLLAVGRAAVEDARDRPDEELNPKPVRAGPGADLKFDEVMHEVAAQVRVPPLTPDPEAATDPEAALALAAEWTREGYRRWVAARRLLARMWQAVECLRKTTAEAVTYRELAAEREKSATERAGEQARSAAHKHGELTRTQSNAAALTEENRQLKEAKTKLELALGKAKEREAGLRQQLDDRDALLARREQEREQQRRRADELGREWQRGERTRDEVNDAVAELGTRAGVPVAIRLAVLGCDLLVAAAVVAAVAVLVGPATAGSGGLTLTTGAWAWWAVGFWVAVVAAGLALYSPGYALFGVRRVRVQRDGLAAVDLSGRLVSAVLHRGVPALAAGFALGWAVLPGGVPPAGPDFLPRWWVEHTPLRGLGAVTLVAWPGVLALCWAVVRLTRFLDGEGGDPWYRNTTVVERVLGLGFLRLPVAPDGPLAQLLVRTARADDHPAD